MTVGLAHRDQLQADTEHPRIEPTLLRIRADDCTDDAKLFVEWAASRSRDRHHFWNPDVMKERERERVGFTKNTAMRHGRVGGRAVTVTASDDVTLRSFFCFCVKGKG